MDSAEFFTLEIFPRHTTPSRLEELNTFRMRGWICDGRLLGKHCSMAFPRLNERLARLRRPPTLPVSSYQAYAENASSFELFTFIFSAGHSELP